MYKRYTSATNITINLGSEEKSNFGASETASPYDTVIRKNYSNTECDATNLWYIKAFKIQCTCVYAMLTHYED